LEPERRSDGEEYFGLKGDAALIKLGDLLVWSDKEIQEGSINDRVSEALEKERQRVRSEAPTPGRFTSQHYEEFDGDFTVKRAQSFFANLWYGNLHPTLILSSKENKEEMMRKLIPNLEMKWHKRRKGFLFNGAIWVDAEEISDGKVYMLNDKQPNDPKFNGWFDTK
jgi:hypothetical protein